MIRSTSHQFFKICESVYGRVYGIYGMGWDGKVWDGMIWSWRIYHYLLVRLGLMLVMLHYYLIQNLIWYIVYGVW